MLAAFDANEVRDIVLGKELRPVVSDSSSEKEKKKLAEWTKKDGVARALIMNSLNSETDAQLITSFQRVVIQMIVCQCM